MADKKKLKVMAKEGRNGIPKDKQGKPLKLGQLVEAEILIKPTAVELDGKKFFLSPELTRICGKLIIIGSKESIIKPKGEKERKVSNAKLRIIA